MSGRPGMRLGRLAPKPHRNTLLLKDYLLLNAPPPPPSKTYYEYRVPPDWTMMANDNVGDCTCADAGHRVMLWTAHTGAIVTPTSADVLQAYSAITGYNPAAPPDQNGNNPTDNGAAMTDVFEYCRTTGIAGHKLDAWVQVDFKNLEHVRQAIYLFGHLSIGVNLPDLAMNQFGQGLPWDITSEDDGGIDGGHDVPIFGYGSQGFTCVTWGRLQKMGIPWFQKYVEEAYAAISLDWLASTGLAPNHLNIDSLVADLTALKA